jgi:exopolyphosphatase/guanosine-5'-triphosphate,3'-diphosphate pyrophosphatase
MDGTDVNVAAIDIGSNSVRLLVLDESGDQLVRRTAVTALGRGVDATGRFREDTVAATLDVMSSYADALKQHEVGRVRAVATSASRDAENGPELMDAIGAIIGAPPAIIDGNEEAELAFAGATANIDGDPPFLVIDIGGGSTEFVYGATEPVYATSINIGSVRLSDRKLPDRPPTATQMSEASFHADAEFSTVELPGTPRTVIGVAGTFTSLAAINLGLAEYNRDVVHGSILKRSECKELISELSALTVEETAAIPSLDPKRAPVILAGTVLADRACVVAGTAEIVVSEYGLLNALANQLLLA